MPDSASASVITLDLIAETPLPPIEGQTTAALSRLLAGVRLRLERARDAGSRGFAGLDFATDLADDIGSGRWWRGCGLLMASAATALAFWPSFGVDVPGATRVDDPVREEYRSQMVMPLAFGGDTGRGAGPGSMVVPVASAPERPRLQLVATLSQGDSLARVLQRAGVSDGDIAGLTGAIGGAVPVADIAPGTRFDITLGRHPGPGQPRPLEAMAFRARFDLDLAITHQGSVWQVHRQLLAVDTTPLRIRGVIGGSLFHSARAAGAPMKAIQQYLQAVDAHLSLDDLHQGATFDMIVAYRRSAAGDGKVQADVGDLIYAGIEEPGGKSAQLLRWGAGKGASGQFFDAATMTDNRVSNALVLPVANARITSGYGMRFHPILGYARMHSGTDLAAPYGSPVYAVADGLVQFSGWHGGHGNYLRLNHGGGVETGYGHLSRFAVTSGMRVHAGEIIAYVGTTGLSTGPHLHYEVFRDGASIDPMSAHFTVRAGVDKGEIAAFRARLRQVLTVRPGAAFGPIGGNSGGQMAATPGTHIALR